MAAVAQIGYGHWGRNLARNLSELGVLRAVVDPDSQAAHAAASTLSVRAAAFDEVLADPAIDGVSLASPAALHFGQAKAALEAGKHVFVEKPLALDIGEAEALVALARTKDRVLMVGHLLQYHPIYVRLRELVAAGELGRLNYVYSNRMSLGKFRAEENVLWSFAPHDISMILGLYGSEPVHVTAQGSVAYTAGIADMATLQMHFADGGSGHVQACWMHPFKEQRLVAMGEHAMAVFDDSEPDWDAKLKIYRHRVDRSGPVPNLVRADAEAVVVPRGEPLKAECAHFVECIDRGLTPRTDGAEGLSVLKVLHAAELALAQNLKHQRSRT